MIEERTHSIIARLVPLDRRSVVVEEIFKVAWPLRVEPTIFNMADTLCPTYKGGYWNFHTLSNGGFFCHPEIASPVKVASPNSWDGELSEVGFGITCCLMAYSHLSFGDDTVAVVCTEQFHLLREFMFQLSEHDVQGVLACID